MNGEESVLEDPARVQTIEAFADTIVPGERRGPDDRAVAGAAAGPGAVAAGALELLRWPAGGLSDSLDGLADILTMHAEEYAARRGVELDPAVPAFVALGFEDRTALVLELTAPEHPEKQLWVGLALFSNMAFDSAAHLATADAFAQGHPGLRHLGYTPPGADGLWRFPQYSYRRPLAPLHPGTTSTGSPA
ncbi:DUF5987 family protein [Actinoplanes teichomyceticus]|uniref:Gluconate 2-dehydrogenase subunit 3-like protein n=1 Tax=Actinoplanes teichomyceticus TaxID=1867 RepID=A0A561WBU6_ACTTI|nr:DUF5987 family protein [Actinoplanes teichomyceticus]TWG21336.1 hypothetical protein FHX34_103874 [Actinoplanes teichomyceticus]GIF16421.1 hypothetical protein Ate01nite_64530 [Actinoplanes teichomyceticus]